MKRFNVTCQLVLVFVLTSTLTGYAQQELKPDRCSVKMLENAQRFENWLQHRSLKTAKRSTDIYKIPVVVHVLHLGDSEGEGTNLSKEQIESQIRILNEDFRRKEGTPGFNTHPDGGDAKIEFLLARTSPDGEATDGIVRVNMNLVKKPDTLLGSAFNYYGHYSYWNPDEYLNIWTVPDWPQEALLGKATGPITDLPGGDRFEVPTPVDGILINAPNFGQSDNSLAHGMGRTATHEIGHYLGLLHIWGAVGCDRDDYCEDTPPQDRNNNKCPATPLLACDGQPAMVENYMDYTPDSCMNIFTRDQIERMHTVLENSPRRKTLTTSPGLKDPSPVTGIPNDAGKAIKVFPIPASDHINIAFSGNQAIGKAEIAFYNLLGKKLFAKTYDKILAGSITLNIPATKEKILFLSLRTEKLDIRRKLVLQ